MRLYKISHILVTLLLFGGVLNTQLTFASEQLRTDAQLHEANLAFSGQEYERAITLYSQLIDTNGYSANLLFNLANSYAQLGKTGQAVLNYQRAHRLAPGDPDIIRNMEVVSKQAGLFEEEQPVLEKLRDYFTFNQWCMAILSGLILLSLISAGSFFLKSRTNAVTAATILISCGIIVCSAAAYFSYSTYNSAVVLTQSNIRISPFEQATSNGSIQAGRLVKIRKEHQQFYLIQEENDRSGWLPKTAVEFITPAAPLQ